MPRESEVYISDTSWPEAPEGFADAVQNLDFDAVEKDIEAFFTDSKEFWPADYGNYAPFFIRLAWHNAGSYRTSDGRGGADGARQRFEPERSWDDNTNLDKARKLLWPIKQKYGEGLSWGDLIVLAGNTAIKSMGGPVLGFCAGRIDDPNGDWSLELGPSMEQNQLAPCAVNGECDTPLGSTTIGLIYLNPEGPMSQPIPSLSAGEVRDTFGRMAMNDSETVALIGGGHAFGKTHGACPAGAGPPPIKSPMNPWPGACGTGKGVDAFTSGFEGPWTANPTSWDNEYFKNLVSNNWEKVQGPGGKWMWQVSGTSPMAPAANGNGTQNIMMLTSDVSLLHDPTGEYQKLVALYAEDQTTFEHNFAHAWYKLTTRDMGPITRCLGKHVPPAQDWQKPLPAPLPWWRLANFDHVKHSISTLLSSNGAHKAQLARLAYSCASTFRVTDYLGGCNGASLRFSPQKDWPENAGLQKALAILEPIKAKFGAGLSWADLIVLAGDTAIENAMGVTSSFKFCGGRTDSMAGVASDAYLRPKVAGLGNDTLAEVKDASKVMGLTSREWVALAARPVDEGFRFQAGLENKGWAQDPTVVSNLFFQTLITEDWEEHTVPSSGAKQYKAAGKDLFMLHTDLMIKYDPELLAIAQEFASSNKSFLEAFAYAWRKLVISDRFDGPTANLCSSRHQSEEVQPL